VPNPIPRYLAFNDVLALIDGFQNQYTYLTLSDQLILSDNFQSNLKDASFGDHIYFTEHLKLTNLNVHLSDQLSLTDSFKNITNLAFSDALFLIDVFNPLIMGDALVLSDSFIVTQFTSWGDVMILSDEFDLHGAFGRKFGDKLNLGSYFSYYKLPQDSC